MFTAPSDTLLTTLDKLLGSRVHTQEVIALASAAVLTASPIGEENSWLAQVQQCIPRAPANLREVLLCNHGGIGGTANHPSTHLSQADRQNALQYLLDALHEEYGSNAPAMLARLSQLAAEALASANAQRVTRWGELLLRTHRSVQQGYLANNPDLN